MAIKTIKKAKIETEADLVRIRREIQIMSSVRHPNIIHIYEVFENKEKMVLVMEYAAGGELYDEALEAAKLDRRNEIWPVVERAAKRAGVPINVLLGKAVRKSVPVYANINRGARDRSPDGVAQSARSAVASGFNAVKIAPFDGAYYADVNKQDLCRNDGRRYSAATAGLCC